MTLAWQLSCPGLDAAWTAGARAPINLSGGRMGNCYKRAPIFSCREARDGNATRRAWCGTTIAEVVGTNQVNGGMPCCITPQYSW